MTNPPIDILEIAARRYSHTLLVWNHQQALQYSPEGMADFHAARFAVHRAEADLFAVHALIDALNQGDRAQLDHQPRPV